MERIVGATIDVLVSDLNLGQGPGGIDVVRGLREVPRHAAVPAVAVSAYGTEEDQRETFGAGFAGHLVKPVNSAVVSRPPFASCWGEPARGASGGPPPSRTIP